MNKSFFLNGFSKQKIVSFYKGICLYCQIILIIMSKQSKNVRFYTSLNSVFQYVVLQFDYTFSTDDSEEGYTLPFSLKSKKLLHGLRNQGS